MEDDAEEAGRELLIADRELCSGELWLVTWLPAAAG